MVDAACSTCPSSRSRRAENARTATGVVHSESSLRRVVLGEQGVDAAARLGQDLERLLGLLTGSGMGRLHRGRADLKCSLTQSESWVVGSGRQLLPGMPARALEQLSRSRATLVGQRVHALALSLLAHDQSLVLEQLEGRVDRARARAPQPAAPGLELLDDLVAVHRLFGEQGEDAGADVTATGSPPASAHVPRPRTAPRPAEAERWDPCLEGRGCFAEEQDAVGL